MSPELKTLDYETPSGPKGPDWWALASLLLAIPASIASFGLAFLLLVQTKLPGEAAEVAGGYSTILVFCCGFPGAFCGLVSITRRGPTPRAVVGLVVGLLATCLVITMCLR